MSGFPRPVFAGDFQSVKFYDLAPPDDRINIPLNGIAPVAHLTTRNVVKGHLYEVVFGPFIVGRSTVPVPIDFVRLIVAYRAPSAQGWTVVRRFPVEAQRPMEPFNSLSAYFVAPETGDYTIAVSAQRPNAAPLGSVTVISLDNSILGIRGVASPGTDFVIQTTPEA